MPVPFQAGALFYHILKQKQLARAARGSAFGMLPGILPKTDENGKVRMTDTRIYIGLNDAETRKQLHGTEKYLELLKDVCKSYHVAFSVDVEEGGYYHEDGEYTEETSLVLILIDADRDVVEKIAKDLRNLFHQESVLVTEHFVEGYFVAE